MAIDVEQIKSAGSEKQTIKWYDIPYRGSDYTFPDETLVQHVRFDDNYIQLELTDGRILSVPLAWIPSLYHASSQDREKYTISRDRKLVIWDPNQCAINDEVRIDDYLIPRRNR